MKDLGRRVGLVFEGLIFYAAALAFALFPAGVAAGLIWQACKSGY